MSLHEIPSSKWANGKVQKVVISKSFGNSYPEKKYSQNGVCSINHPRDKIHQVLVDLYCGVGLFALSAVNDFERIYGVEVCFQFRNGRGSVLLRAERLYTKDDDIQEV